MTMHTYWLSSDKKKWIVGIDNPPYDNPNACWTSTWIREFDLESDAAMFVSFLNGGERPLMLMKKIASNQGTKSCL